MKIDLVSFAEVVRTRVDNDDAIMNNHLLWLQDKFDAIRKIADGLDIWNDTTNVVASKLREFY